MCEANPDIVYFSTGETELRGNIMPGNGVYKSTDAGKTWKSVGLKSVQNFSRIRIDPTNCNTVFAGGFGHYGTPGADRGVYKSSDGGATWRKVLYRDPRTGAVDISIDPKNPKVIYAALWEAWRKPWGMSSGGPGSGLFKSVDGGEHWTELTRNPGMPRRHRRQDRSQRLAGRRQPRLCDHREQGRRRVRVRRCRRDLAPYQ